MKLNPDDPRLTAYALGELPENERHEIEAELQSSPECRRVVEEIQQTAKTLSDQLATEPCAPLLPAQREAITNQLLPANVVRLPRRRMLTIGLAAAACLTLLLALQFTELNSHRDNSQIAFSDLPDVMEIAAPAPTVLMETAVEQIVPAQSDRGLERLEPQRALHEGIDYVDPVKPSLSTTTSTLSLDSLTSAAPSSPVPSQTGQPVEIPQVAFVSQPAGAGGRGGFGGGGGGEGARGGTANLGKPLSSSLTANADEREVLDRYYFREAKSSEALGTAFEERRIRGQIRDTGPGTARYPRLIENSFLSARNSPLSTFSIDVDTASYANVRRFLK
jgi:Ca-activated chloride channel homolog